MKNERTSIEFDVELAALVEAAYLTPDVVAQRLKTLDMMGVGAGDRVLDIGSGPGLLLKEIAAIVGETGLAAGVDASDSMIALSKNRCSKIALVHLEQADAINLPFADETFDNVVSSQTLEYVEDLDRALSEARRILKPNGRMLIVDTCWDSVSWNSSNAELMARILKGFEGHVAHPNLPYGLSSRLENAGFTVTAMEAFPLLNTRYSLHSYSAFLMRGIFKYVTEQGEIEASDATDWFTDLTQHAEAEDWFFSINRYVFNATRL